MMRLLFLLLLWTCSAGAQELYSVDVGAFDKVAISTTQHTRPRWVISGSGNSANNGCCASFVLPLNDLGAGAVNTTPSFSLGSGTATFTRATTAWTKLSTGLWASVATGVARSCYLGMNTAVGAYGGYLAEGARTNDCLWSRDLTNAAWTKGATITVAHTATGIDGAANSATVVTGGAVAATNIVTQAITLASQADTFSCWVERITGTGAISLTLDNVTYTDISGSINSSTYTLVQIQQTVLNPTVGIKVTTNLDSVAVDQCQMEPGGFASTPIPTTTVAVTRNADVLSYPAAGNINNATGTAYAEFMLNGGAGVLFTANHSILTSDGTGYMLYTDTNANNKIDAYDGVNNPTVTSGNSFLTNVVKVASAWGGSSLQVFKDGTAGTATSFGGSMHNTTNFLVGSHAATEYTFGIIRNVTLWQNALSTPYLQLKTTDATDWLGDPFWNVAANDEQYWLRANQ